MLLSNKESTLNQIRKVVSSSVLERVNRYLESHVGVLESGKLYTFRGKYVNGVANVMNVWESVLTKALYIPYDVEQQLILEEIRCMNNEDKKQYLN